MKLLYLDACPRRRGLSRTLRLADAFLSECQSIGYETEYVELGALSLTPHTGERLELRDKLIESGDYSHPMFAHAAKLKEADAVLIAAPYWDLGFPAVLKLYFENVIVAGLTFTTDERGGFVGLCRSRRLMYVTTAGGCVNVDFGFPYVYALSDMLGLGDCSRIAGEGLDLWENDPEAIVCSLLDGIPKAAKSWTSGQILQLKM